QADGDAAAVVGHGKGAVGVDADLDRLGMAPHGLVDRVVDDLVDEVVEAARSGVPDEHAGALANRLQALEDLDLGRAVVAGRCRRFRHSVHQQKRMPTLSPGILRFSVPITASLKPRWLPRSPLPHDLGVAVTDAPPLTPPART